MNKMKFMVLFMSITMIFSGCASMNNTGKGAAIGGGSGKNHSPPPSRSVGTFPSHRASCRWM